MTETGTLPRMILRLPALRDPLQRERVLVSLSVVIFILVIAAALAYSSAPLLSGTSQREGETADADIIAPASVTFASPILTGQRQEAARSAVSPVYTLPDPNVARRQLEALQERLNALGAMRADPDSAFSADILSDEQAGLMRQMSDERWQVIAAEAAAVLERIMRQSIRDLDVTAVRDALPLQVSARLTEPEAALVIALIADLVLPNRTFNSEATSDAQQAAADSVLPQTRSYTRGEVVVSAGAILSALDEEALREMGLLVSGDQRLRWLGRALLAAVLSAAAALLYLARTRPAVLTRPRELWLAEGIFLIGILTHLVFNVSAGTLYFFPAAAVPLLFVGLMGAPTAVAAAALQAVLIALMSGGSLEAAVLVSFGGAVGALMLRASDRINRYFFVGLIIAVVNMGVVTLFALDNGPVAAGDLARSVALAGLNGIIAAMGALAGLYAITLIFNMPTSIKLVELSQPGQPLMQRLLREAPGTYQHSLQVANLAEQAASAIGANAELVRVAALYHDIGKILNPAFFIENQVDGYNPHEAIGDPFRSADLIISHVADGDRLARQYRLPGRIREFIREHHGTTRVQYFLTSALAASHDPDQVDVEQFSYPGPRPQSRETAILMLADSSESIVRARKPANRGEISTIIREIVESRIADGQLDASDLTLHDIETIRNTFVEMLQGVFHPRINYPGTLSRLHSQEMPQVRAVEQPQTTAPVSPQPATRPAEEDQPMAEVPPLRRTRTVPAVAPAESEPDDAAG